MAAVLNREAVFSPDYIPNTVTPSLQERETIWEAQTEIKRILKRPVRIIDRAVPCMGWNVSYFARKGDLMGICICVKKRNIGHSSAYYTQILYRVSLKCLLKVWKLEAQLQGTESTNNALSLGRSSNRAMLQPGLMSLSFLKPGSIYINPWLKQPIRTNFQSTEIKLWHYT